MALARRQSTRGCSPASRVWYDRLTATELVDRFGGRLGKKGRILFAKPFQRARRKTSARAVKKLTEQIDGELRFRTLPPLLVPLRVLSDVGTRAWVFLLLGRDGKDPLVLQAKEAQSSVLEPHLGASKFENNGERVVQGQRISQAARDIFLGWQRSTGLDGIQHDFYVRQLWDWKASIDLSTMSESGLHAYTRACGWSIGPYSCALRRPARDSCLPWQRLVIRQRDRPLLSCLRRPE